MKSRPLLAGIGALALAAVLAFLFFKTEAIDPKQSNAVLEHLRELKDIDTRWELEMLRARADPLAPPASAAATPEALERAQRGLAESAAGLRSPALDQGLPLLAAALKEKATLVVLVDARGQRFVNEDASIGRTSDAIVAKADATAWLVVDDAIHGRTQARHRLAAVEESFEALEAALGIPDAALVRTLEAYNRAAEKGEDFTSPRSQTKGLSASALAKIMSVLTYTQAGVSCPQGPDGPRCDPSPQTGLSEPRGAGRAGPSGPESLSRAPRVRSLQVGTQPPNRAGVSDHQTKKVTGTEFPTEPATAAACSRKFGACHLF